MGRYQAKPLASESPQKGLGELSPSSAVGISLQASGSHFPNRGLARANQTKSASRNRDDVPKFPQRRTCLVGPDRILRMNRSKM